MRKQQMRAGVLFLVLAGCSRKAATPDHTAGDSLPADSASASHPSGMQLQARPMLPGFQAHLDSLAHTPAMMHREMAAHRSEVRHLVDAMHSDMVAAGMASDASYEALADSVVKGSAELATASGADFNRRVTQHIDQLRRLTAKYQSMTAGMKLE
jgi:hypothetical protein